MRRFPLLLAFCVLSLALAAGAGAQLRQGAGAESGPFAWTAYGGDNQLTSFSPGSSVTAAEARGFSLQWSVQLDGAVIATPLVLDGRVYAATEAGSVYALNLVTGRLLWKRTLDTQNAAGGCGSFGISGTGAIDAARGLLYVISGDGQLQALRLHDGTTAPGWPLLLTGRPEIEYVWGGLRIVGDRLYVPFASYCDGTDAQGRAGDGRVVAIDLTTPSVAAMFDTVPGPDNLGGVWGYGGVSAEPDGSAIYTAVGNSWVTDPVTGGLFDAAGYGDSVVRLTADLVPVSSNRPATVPTVGDYDFGAAPLLFQPSGCPPLAAANNKDGLLYVWDRTALERGPLFSTGIGTVSEPFVGAPSWSPVRQLLFDGGTAIVRDGTNLGDGVSAFSVGADCTFEPAWSTVTGVGTQPAPLVAGDIVFATGGYSGGFKALDAETGAVLWSFPTGAPTLSGPSAAGNLVLAGDYDGVVRAFGPSYLGTEVRELLQLP